MKIDLAQISSQLDSPNSRDRMLALAYLRDFSPEEAVPLIKKVLYDEMSKIKARSPLVGMGTAMIGPTLLEYGTEEQKQRHIPKIARGEVQLCQGYC